MVQFLIITCCNDVSLVVVLVVITFAKVLSNISTTLHEQCMKGRCIIKIIVSSLSSSLDKVKQNSRISLSDK